MTRLKITYTYSKEYLSFLVLSCVIMLLMMHSSCTDVEGTPGTYHTGVKQWGAWYGVSGKNVITNDDVLPPGTGGGVASVFCLFGTDWSFMEVGFIKGETGHSPYCYSPCFYIEESSRQVSEYYFKILNKNPRYGTWHNYKIYSVPWSNKSATW